LLYKFILKCYTYLSFMLDEYRNVEKTIIADKLADNNNYFRSTVKTRHPEKKIAIRALVWHLHKMLRLKSVNGFQIIQFLQIPTIENNQNYWKESLNSDSQQFHQYQPNEQRPLTTKWTITSDNRINNHLWQQNEQSPLTTEPTIPSDNRAKNNLWPPEHKKKQYRLMAVSDGLQFLQYQQREQSPLIRRWRFFMSWRMIGRHNMAGSNRLMESQSSL